MARPTLLAAAAALLLPTAARAGGMLGLGPGPDIVIAYSYDASSKNVSFDVSCFPHTGEGPIAWCAFGIAPAPGMNPAYVFWLGVDAADKPFAVEDRAISAMAQPPCLKTQLTHTSAMAYNKTSGVLSASFSRAATVDSALEKLGYMSFKDSLQFTLGAMQVPDDPNARHLNPNPNPASAASAITPILRQRRQDALDQEVRHGCERALRRLHVSG